MQIASIRKEVAQWSFKNIGPLNFIRIIEWKKMIEWLDPNGGENILDVACGWGEFSYKIAIHECNVHGIDMSKAGISSAKHLVERDGLSCNFLIGSADALPYKDNYFDKIVCSSSLEHFTNDAKALDEMNRVLKPGGILVLTTDSFSYPIDKELIKIHKKIASVINYYTYDELDGLLKKAGFKVEVGEYLFNSRISSFFFNIGIETKWTGKKWMMIFFIAYPLSTISDRLFGIKDKGYTLIMRASRV